MFEWWNSLGITMQVFYCIALPATLIIVIQTILLMIGIGHGGEGVEFSDTSGIDGLDVPDAIHIDKPSFGYTHWDKFCFEKIELVGLCTDICVVSNALILKALFPNAEISVDSACCAGVTPETHNSALATMKMCQIDVV